MDVSHGQDLRHSLYTTLDGAFPKSIMPIGVEHNLKQKIRKKLRKVGWDTLFRPGEEWERTVGGFAIRALDIVYTAYGQNPWFWGVAWPAVLGAAAADFWPHVATPLERRAVAHDATKGHLNALFAAHATEGTDLLASLPAPVAVAAVAAALGRDRWGRLRDGNSMVEASSAASGATSSADHALAMLKRRALGSQSCHITGGLRLTQVVLGQTCRSLHTWFSTRLTDSSSNRQLRSRCLGQVAGAGRELSGPRRLRLHEAPAACRLSPSLVVQPLVQASRARRQVWGTPSKVRRHKSVACRIVACRSVAKADAASPRVAAAMAAWGAWRVGLRQTGEPRPMHACDGRKPATGGESSCHLLATRLVRTVCWRTSSRQT